MWGEKNRSIVLSVSNWCPLHTPSPQARLGTLDTVPQQGSSVCLQRTKYGHSLLPQNEATFDLLHEHKGSLTQSKEHLSQSLRVMDALISSPQPAGVAGTNQAGKREVCQCHSDAVLCVILFFSPFMHTYMTDKYKEN